MNPAAFSALANGDMSNFIAASTPGGIEAQEAQGQRDLVKTADRLPADMRPGVREALESIGFVFGERVSEIFLQCQMPEGWSIQPTDHSMHSDLVDPAGNVRGGVFYKAAFYDRKAHLSLNPRYFVSCDYEKPTSTHFIMDVKTKARHHVVGTSTYSNFKEGDAMGHAAHKWLDDNLPNHKDPLAYWAD